MNKMLKALLTKVVLGAALVVAVVAHNQASANAAKSHDYEVGYAAGQADAKKNIHAVPSARSGKSPDHIAGYTAGNSGLAAEGANMKRPGTAQQE